MALTDMAMGVYGLAVVACLVWAGRKAFRGANR
jgi:hypothetical protein